ncbi:MAG: response regulator transcription factor [Nitrospira sp.]|nr:response regulator transcription factor [Nitrospira sp.]
MSRKSFRQLTIYKGGTSIRVVIVERRAHVRKEIRNLLEQDGEVEIAGVTRSPENVLPLIHARQPDVVLIEAGHPDGHGIQTCQEIRGRFPDTRIIFLAAKAESDMIRRAISAGCHGYLVEPLSSNRIIPAVKAVAQDSFYFDFTGPASLTGGTERPGLRLEE